MEFAAANALMDSYRTEFRAEAREYLEMPATMGDEPLPAVSELMKREGDPKKGKTVFMRLCFQCHKVDGQGIEFGPDLSEIGSKLAEREMYTAILDPSAAVSHGFETQRVKLTDGSEVLGYITSDTDSHLTLRIQGGIDRKIPKSKIASREQLDRSLMTPNLQQAMKQQELIDLVHYLQQQKEAEEQ